MVILWLDMGGGGQRCGQFENLPAGVLEELDRLYPPREAPIPLTWEQRVARASAIMEELSSMPHNQGVLLPTQGEVVDPVVRQSDLPEQL